jgi:hypothetical protein
MAQRFDTDGGTAFNAPLVLVDENNEILATLDPAGFEGNVTFKDDVVIEGELEVQTGPVVIDGADSLPAAADDQSGGTADTTDWELVAVGATDAADESGPINDNFATIAEILNRLLDRIQ